jgi:hypothetical protein
MNKDRNL